MAISERIWLIIFTVLEGIVPFLCYFYPKAFSYEAMLFLLPIGMAVLYLLFFGKERLFETDVTEYGTFQMYLAAALGYLCFVGIGDDTQFLLLMGSGVTIVIDDVIFVIIFIVIGKVYGLESIYSKKRKEEQEFYNKEAGPYGGYRNTYEKMYWEELERRQREQFRQKKGTWENVQWEKNSEFRQNYQEMPKEPQPKFLFEKTLYFRSISSLEEVRPRYLSLMKKYHPDMPGGSKEIAQEIQSEYDKICKENGL
ncbi:MAG: hypothetical protein HDR22_09500 [Lachnospiraceae bacterium]|nr:hypothetical protein [Lachnospiraceae bacterium]